MHAYDHYGMNNEFVGTKMNQKEEDEKYKRKKMGKSNLFVRIDSKWQKKKKKCNRSQFTIEYSQVDELLLAGWFENVQVRARQDIEAEKEEKWKCQFNRLSLAFHVCIWWRHQ